MSSESFADLGVSRPILGALAERGISEPFAVQRLCIADVLAGEDVLVQSPTGSGKTLAFGIPMADRIEADSRRPAALILAPTRELAEQIVDELRSIAQSRALKIAPVFGGVGIQAQARKAAQAHIVVATPGRLEDLLDRGAFNLKQVQILVLDEADRMLDMGFLPDVTRILEMLRPERQTMLFSATLDGEVGRLAARFTRDPVRHEVVDDMPTVAEAEHRFVAVDHERKKAALVRELAADRGLTLVFVRTKRGADRLARVLKTDGYRVGALHGGMTQSARERALGQFARGNSDVLIATDVAARGLDLDDITHVVNFDPPEDEKAYVHRVGRTARAGRTGTGITFVTPQQRGDVGRMAQVLELHEEFAGAGLRLDAPRVGQQPRNGQPRHGQRRHGHQSRGGRPQRSAQPRQADRRRGR